MADDGNGNSGAEDQDVDTGVDQDTNDTDTGADDGQDNSGDEGNDSSFEQKFKDQQGRASKAEASSKAYKQRLVDAGLDPETGKPPKESRAPKKDGNVLSEADAARITRAEERADLATLRSMGITHAEDIKVVRDAAKRLGVDVEEAAGDEFVKAKIDRQQKVRTTKEATPDPSKRGGNPTRTGKLPDFSKMSDAEFDKWERENRR